MGGDVVCFAQFRIFCDDPEGHVFADQFLLFPASQRFGDRIKKCHRAVFIRCDDRLAEVAKRRDKPLLVCLRRFFRRLPLFLNVDIIQRKAHVSRNFLQQGQFLLIRGNLRRKADE